MPLELGATARHHPQRAIAAGPSNPLHAKELASQQRAQYTSHMMTPLRAIETLLTEQRCINSVRILQLEADCAKGRHFLRVQLIVLSFVQQYTTR